MRRLEVALHEAQVERDRALEELADVRSELNRLRMSHVHRSDPATDEWCGDGSDALPLRYRVADRLNEGTKRLFAPGHSLIKALLARR